MSGYINLESVGSQIDTKSTDVSHNIATNIIHKPQEPKKLEKKIESTAKVNKEQKADKQKLETFRKNNLGKATKSVNAVFDLFGIRREFSISQNSKRIIIKILDKETGDLIREIPPEKFWDNYSKMQESIGLAVDMKG